MFRRLKSGMEEFETSSDTWNWLCRSSSQVRMLGIRNGGVRDQLRRLESGMEEFEPSSDASTRKRLSSSPVIKLGIVNGGV